MSQRKGSGAPQQDGSARSQKKQRTDVTAEVHLSLEMETALSQGLPLPASMEAHVAHCRPCQRRVAAARELYRWQEALLRAPLPTAEAATASEPDEQAEEEAAAEAYRRYQANRKTLDEMKPFRLRLERATGRLTRVDRRRPKGPRGVIEGGVRLPLDPRHAADVLVAGSPPGLEIVIAQIQGGRPVRFIRGAQVGMRDGKRWQTSSTDPTGRVRLDVDIRRRRKPIQVEIAHTLSSNNLLGKIEIEVV